MTDRTHICESLVQLPSRAALLMMAALLSSLWLSNGVAEPAALDPAAQAPASPETPNDAPAQDQAPAATTEGSTPTVIPMDEDDSSSPRASSPRRRSVASVCDDPGSDPRSPDDQWIDQMQRGAYYGICGTAYWFDGLFGTTRYGQDAGDSFGRLGIFPGWDRRNGIDTRIRLRARFVLPAMEDRLALVVGRGDQQDITEERASSTGTRVPASFRRIEDDEWLVGLAYARRQPFENGFDAGTGIRIRAPLDPYVKAGYRHHFPLGEKMLLRARETVFWRNSRGLGSTTELMLDRIVGDNHMLRWDNSGTIAQDTDGIEWGTSLSLFRDLSDRRAIVHSLVAEGETRAEVRLQNYGVESRYRQRIVRQWLFLEVAVSATWPRETLEERRRFNPGISIGFDMFFGPVPEREMR